MPMATVVRNALFGGAFLVIAVLGAVLGPAISASVGVRALSAVIGAVLVVAFGRLRAVRRPAALGCLFGAALFLGYAASYLALRAMSLLHFNWMEGTGLFGA